MEQNHDSLPLPWFGAVPPRTNPPAPEAGPCTTPPGTPTPDVRVDGRVGSLVDDSHTRLAVTIFRSGRSRVESRMPAWTPSIVPSKDETLYLVLDDFGRH